MHICSYAAPGIKPSTLWDCLHYVLKLQCQIIKNGFELWLVGLLALNNNFSHRVLMYGLLFDWRAITWGPEFLV